MKNKTIKIVIFTIALIISTQFVSQTINQNISYAEDKQSSTQTKNPLIIPKPSTLPGTSAEGKTIRSWFSDSILPKWTQGMIGFTGALAFLMMVISGFRYLTAYGNEESATSAKKMLIYSALGLVLAITSYAIVSIIINIKFA